MRTSLGIVLIALSVPYTLFGLLLGWSSVAMGATALVVAGGVLVARGRRRRRVHDGPVMPADPRVPTIPPLPPEPPPGGEEAGPPPLPDPADWQERDVILPPAPAKPGGTPKLTLIHSDGRRCDVRDFRRRAVGK